MTLITYISFSFILFMFFRGLIVIYKLYNKKNFVVDELKIFNIPLYIFYQVLALFIIGNLTIFLNFFFPLKNLQAFYFALVIVIVFFNSFEKFNFKDPYFLFISLIIVPAILSVSSYGLKLHFDAIDYHLNFQYWIRESKAVFGLSNLYIGYGWSTIYDYILSNFWLADNFIFLHFVNLIFFSLFYSFLIYNLIFSENQFLKIISMNLTIFGLLDNFGIGGGANGFLNIQMISKPDLSTGVLFFICFVLFLNDYVKDEYKISNFIFLSALSLFAFQIKIVSASLVVLLIIYLYKILPIYKLSLVIRKLGLLFLFFLIYLIKNIIISGCIIFPVSFTCFETFYWTDKFTVSSFSSGVSNGNFALTSFQDINIWFNSWINHAYNFQVFTNFLLSFSIILLFNRVFFVQRSSISRNKATFVYTYCLFLIAAFFVTGPTVRYGYGLFIAIIGVISLKRFDYKYKNPSKKLESFYVIFILISVLLTPRIYSYQEFIKSPFELYEPIDSTQEYLQSDSLKNEVDIQFKNSKCFIAVTCIKNKDYQKIKENIINSYSVYYFDEKK